MVRRWIPAVAAAIFILGLTALPGLAAPPQWEEWPGNKKLKEQNHIQTESELRQGDDQNTSSKGKNRQEKRFRYRDVEGHWAREAMLEASARGLVKGYPDLTFQPEKPVTQLETIVMMVRALGLEEEAQDKAQAELPVWLKHQNQVPSWARGYLAAALDHGLLTPLDLINFQPNKPAKRWEVSVILARALQIEVENGREASEPLNFTDFQAIPEEAQKYIASVVEQGLLRGDPGGALRPLAPVKRCEMATILLRLGEKLENILDLHELKGTITAVDAGKITLAIQGGATVTLEVAEDAVIFLDGQDKELTDIKPGDHVKVIVQDEKVVFIKATSPEEEELEGIEGIIQAVYGPEVTICLDNGETKTFAITGDTEIIVDGEQRDALALEAGQEIEVILEEDAVIKIIVHNTAG